MEKIMNLTQHIPTPEQKQSGVVNIPERHKEIKTLLTFEEIPNKNEMEDRAIRLTKIVAEEGYQKALIGGAPYFMSILEKTLKEHGIQPVYSFSKRIVEEQQDENGNVVKKVVFKHIGFIEI